jgi:hypothetical protein
VSGAPAQVHIIVTTICGGTQTALDHDDESEEWISAPVLPSLSDVKPEAVRRYVAVNVLELSISTEYKTTCKRPRTTLLCPRDIFFAYFDHLLSNRLIDRNVLTEPRAIFRIQWDMLIWSLRSPVTAPRCLRPAQRNPSFELLSTCRILPQYCALHSGVSYDFCPQTFPFFHSALFILEMIQKGSHYRTSTLAPFYQ